MPLNERIITSVQEIVEDWLKTHNIPYFVGGSRRFGWHREGMSDADLFVLRTEEYSTGDTPIEKLVGGIWSFVNCSEYPVDDQYALGPIVHINFMSDKDVFEDLKSEHEVLKKFINQHSILIEVAKSMKIHGFPGSEVFKVFSFVAKSYA